MRASLQKQASRLASIEHKILILSEVVNKIDRANHLLPVYAVDQNLANLLDQLAVDEFSSEDKLISWRRADDQSANEAMR